MEENDKEEGGESHKVDFFASEERNNDADLLEEELYGDLSVDLKQEMTYPELKKLYEESKAKIQEVLKENQILKEQNIILKKNISSLYLTAREEIQRKDAQMKALQDREIRSKQFKAQRMQKDAGT